jgi:hypothetical protein
MQEIWRGNDIVRLSRLEAALAEAQIPCFVFDRNVALVDGSINAFQQRLMVTDEDYLDALELVKSLDE